MNRAVLASDLYHHWRIFALTSSQSSTWGFDRFRLYYPADYTKIGCFTEEDYNNNAYTLPNGQHAIGGEPSYGYQDFRSDNQYEHDFTFDLSSNPADSYVYVAISGIPKNAEFQQVYCYPTGYGGTRGLDADIVWWDYSVVNTTTNIGGADTSLFFDNQPSFGLLGTVMEWKDTTRTPALYSKTMKFNNSAYQWDQLDKIIIWTDNGGVTNGSLDYSGTGDDPSNASRAAYDSLISKGWSITGTAPPQ